MSITDYSKSIDQLQNWARILYNFEFTAPNNPRILNWNCCERLIASATKYVAARFKEMSILIQEVERSLQPLQDPRRVGFRLHRWLCGQREEAYSDWLAWSLTELGTGKRLGKVLFGDNIPEHFRGSDDGWQARREVWVPRGHDDHTGRLDCVLSYPHENGDLKILIVIEVKVVGADEADTVKQKGYCEWLEEQRVHFRHKFLLATDGDDQKDYEGFKLLTWENLCIQLRRILPEIIKEGRLTTASLILAFVGAVEQNILQVCYPHFDNKPADYAPLPEIDRLIFTITYLRKLLSQGVS